MKKSTITVLAIGALMGTATFVISQERPDRPRGGQRGDRGNFMAQIPLFVALDKDKDGELSKEEIEKATVALKTLDKDEDGKLGRTEIFGERRRGFGRRGERGDEGDGDRPERPSRPRPDSDSDSDN